MASYQQSCIKFKNRLNPEICFQTINGNGTRTSRYGGISLHIIIIIISSSSSSSSSSSMFLAEVETMTGRSVCDLLSAINCLSNFYKIRRRLSLEQRFSNCGPRTTSGPRVLLLWSF